MLTWLALAAVLAAAASTLSFALACCACLMSSVRDNVSAPNDAHHFQQLVEVERGLGPKSLTPSNARPNRWAPQMSAGVLGVPSRLRDFWENISEEEGIRSRALVDERRVATDNMPVI